MYHSLNIVLNVDINGSANIMRKCIPDAFTNVPLRYDDIVVTKHPAYDAMIRNRAVQKQK